MTTPHINTTENPELLQPLSRSFTTCFYILYLLTFIVGFTGNILVCGVIKRNVNKRSIHFLTLNLAISDLIVLLVYLPMETYQLFTFWEWHLGEVTCQILYSVNACTVNASIYTLVAITRDRFTAVKNPMLARQRNLLIIKIWVAIIWLFSFILTAPLLFVVKVPYFNQCTEIWPSEKASQTYWFTLFGLQFVLPLLFIIFTYSLIIHHLKTINIPLSNSENSYINDDNNSSYKDSRTIANPQNSMKRNTRHKQIIAKQQRREQKNSRVNHMQVTRRRKQQSRMLTMTIILIIVYCLCVLPQHTVYFLTILTESKFTDKELNSIFIIANYCIIVNSSINPIVYGTLNNEIKKGLKHLLMCKSASWGSIILPAQKSFKRLRSQTRLSRVTLTIPNAVKYQVETDV